MAVRYDVEKEVRMSQAQITTNSPFFYEDCGNADMTDAQYDRWFREQVAMGIEDADAGRLLTVEEVNARAETRIAQALSMVNGR